MIHTWPKSPSAASGSPKTATIAQAMTRPFGRSWYPATTAATSAVSRAIFACSTELPAKTAYTISGAKPQRMPGPLMGILPKNSGIPEHLSEGLRHVVFHIGKHFFPETRDSHKRDEDCIEKPGLQVSLRKIEHPVLPVVPVICLECNSQSSVDAVPEYLVAADRVEGSRGDVSCFCTPYETCCHGIEQGIEFSGT